LGGGSASYGPGNTITSQYEGSELNADAFDEINNSEAFYAPTEVQEVIDFAVFYTEEFGAKRTQ